jgi:hypothetical protein
MLVNVAGSANAHHAGKAQHFLTEKLLVTGSAC